LEAALDKARAALDTRDAFYEELREMYGEGAIKIMSDDYSAEKGHFPLDPIALAASA
jgi:hypothetical protein